MASLKLLKSHKTEVAIAEKNQLLGILEVINLRSKQALTPDETSARVGADMLNILEALQELSAGRTWAALCYRYFRPS